MPPECVTKGWPNAVDYEAVAKVMLMTSGDEVWAS
jgi:hypothetical protein